MNSNTNGKAEPVKVVMPKLIDGAKAIEAAITSISNRGKKLDNDVQIVGLSVLAHADKHGDITLINRLYNCMPAGSRRRALAEWLMAFGKVSANADRSTLREAPFVYDKAKKTDLQGAAQEPWFTFAPEGAPADMFDVSRALHGLIARAKKAQQVNDIELLARLQQLDDAAQSRLATAQGTTAQATTH